MSQLFLNTNDQELIESYRKIGLEVNTVDGNEIDGNPVVLFVGSNETDVEKIKSQTEILLFHGSYQECPKFLRGMVLGIIDPALEMETYLPVLNTALSLSNVKSKYDQYGNEFDTLISLVNKEMGRVKKLHEKLVPVRKEKLKGLEFFSKYAAGEEGGGEFFDFGQQENYIFVFMSSTASYVTSSMTLSLFEKIRGIRPGDERIKKHFSDFVSDLNRLNLIDEAKPELAQLMLGWIDLSTLMFEGVNFGQIDIISKGIPDIKNSITLNEEHFEKGSFSFRLTQGAKLCILSPGVPYNYNLSRETEELQEKVKNGLEKGGREFLEQLYFCLKKDVAGDFLPRDSSTIYIEVAKNAIFKV